MLDNRDGISYNETVDPQACNLPEIYNWREESRDPQSELIFFPHLKTNIPS